MYHIIVNPVGLGGVFSNSGIYTRFRPIIPVPAKTIPGHFLPGMSKAVRIRNVESRGGP